MSFGDNGAIAAFQRGDLNQARALTQEQLAAEPQAPRLQHMMGLIQCRMGELGTGVEWLKRASDAEPQNVAYRVMLARALIDSGRSAEALDVATAPRGTSPAELALWHARAEAATAVEAWPQAAEAWHKMCSAGVGDWPAWSNLGDALGAMARWHDAAQALDRAVSLNPDEPSLRRNFAGALNNAGRLEESVEQFRRCIDAAPDDRFLRISLAPILADLGRAKAAQAELSKAAELAGEGEAREDGEGLMRIVINGSGDVDIDALRELADLLERTNRMDALDKLVQEAQSLGIAADRIGYPAAAAALQRGEVQEAKRLLLAESAQMAPVRWHWLMARIEDALSSSAAAFAEAETMNRSFPAYAAWRREGAEQRQAARLLSEAITSDWAAQLPRLQTDQRGAPMFVLGFPRSGTTLLDTFLRGHPETEVLEELPLIHAAETALGDIRELPRRTSAELRDARDAYFAELDRHRARETSGMVIDKLPLNMLAVPIICSLFADTRLIFAQRHPCDVVLSCFMQAFALNRSMASFLNIEDGADFYDAAMTVWSRSCEALSVKVHTIVYEELVTDPAATLRPAIEFLGLEWREALLDHQATARSRGAITTPSYNQVTQPLTRAPIGRWRRYQKQLAPVLPVLLPWAERLGYAD